MGGGGNPKIGLGGANYHTTYDPRADIQMMEIASGVGLDSIGGDVSNTIYFERCIVTTA